MTPRGKSGGFLEDLQARDMVNHGLRVLRHFFAISIRGVGCCLKERGDRERERHRFNHFTRAISIDSRFITPDTENS